MKKRMISLLLCAVMVLGLAACGNNPVADVIQNNKEENAPTAAVNVMALSGPTGVGMAKMMQDKAASYNFTVASENPEVGAALIKGDVDIACVATNQAANLYAKTNSGLTVLAVNTLGVLYVLEKGNSVTNVASLKGKTIYAFGQGANPEFVLDHLLTQNGLDPDKDVNIEWMATAQEVIGKMSQSTKGVCLLPVPAATTLMAKDTNVREAINISAEWDAFSESPLVMGCVVVRNQFLQEHPDLVNQFLADYEASISYMSNPSNVTDAAKIATEQGLITSEAIAVSAIPKCNLVFITGNVMRDTLQGYYEVLFAADPTSIGGGIPDDAFYYIP